MPQLTAAPADAEAAQSAEDAPGSRAGSPSVQSASGEVGADGRGMRCASSSLGQLNTLGQQLASAAPLPILAGATFDDESTDVQVVPLKDMGLDTWGPEED